MGYSIDKYLNLEAIIESGQTLIKSGIKWIGYVILIYAIITNIFEKLEKLELKQGEFKCFSDNKKSFFAIWGIILIAWIPYFLNYYPGIISPDSFAQICEGLGRYTLSNHHPVFHTFIIKCAIALGNAIKDYNLGVAIYSVFQMIFTSSIFSFAIYYMAKRKVDIRIRILTLIFFAFYPVNAIFSITMWKDVPFAAIILLFTIMVTEITINQKRFFESKYRIILLIINMFLAILFRNNGLYVVLLTIPCLFIVAKKYYKQLIIVTCAILAIYIIWTGTIFSILKIKKGSTREALSIPLQQFARVTKYHSDTLTEDEKWRIYKYLPSETLADDYNPKISDAVKNQFDDNAFKEDKLGLVKLYIKLALKYPRATIESFLCNNYGYWYPESVNMVAGRGISETTEEKELSLKLENTPIVELAEVEKFDSLIDRRDLPLNSMLYSIGFNFWVVLACLMYAIYKKQYKLITIYVPVLVLWLTTIASPVFGEYRYIYGMFTSLPILIGIHFRKIDTNKN